MLTAKGKLRCGSQKKQFKGLGVTELDQAELEILKSVQAVAFEKEIGILEPFKDPVENKHDGRMKKSPVCNLNPFRDENGILRVGGRFRMSSLEISC